MTNLMFKGKKVSDGSWTISESYEHATFGNVFVGEDRVDPESVGLYTGLVDVNGDPVFGGDILTVSMTGLDMDVVIMWNKNDARWQADRVIGGKFCDLTAAKVAHWRLIGNIHNRD